MARYTKRPLEIQAVQFTRSNFDEVSRFTEGQARDLTIERRPDGACFCFLHDGKGRWVRVKEGEYLVRYDSGDFGVVDNTSFHNLYSEGEV